MLTLLCRAFTEPWNTGYQGKRKREVERRHSAGDAPCRECNEREDANNLEEVWSLETRPRRDRSENGGGSKWPWTIVGVVVLILLILFIIGRV